MQRTRCASCTVAVHAESRHDASSAASASGFGAGPVSAQHGEPAVARPGSAAARGLGLRPVVDSSDQHVAGAAVGRDLAGEQLVEP